MRSGVNILSHEDLAVQKKKKEEEEEKENSWVVTWVEKMCNPLRHRVLFFFNKGSFQCS